MHGRVLHNARVRMRLRTLLRFGRPRCDADLPHRGRPVRACSRRILIDFALATFAPALALSSPARGQESTDARSCTLATLAASEPPLEFSFVTSVAVDSKGRIYVADRFIKAITVLNQDGSPLTQIGREGDGPGEFRFVWQLYALPGDSLATYDLDQGRLTVFTPEAFGVAYTLSFPQAAPRLGVPNGVLLFPDQRKIVAQYFRTFRPGQDPRGDYNPEQVVHVLNWDGTPERTSVLTLAAPQSLVWRQGGRVGIALFPFGWPARIVRGPDGRLYYGKGDSLQIEIFDLAGQRIGTYSRSYTPPRITRRDLEWAETQVSERFRRALKEAAPERWPAFRQFTVDDKGRMWIGLETPRGQPTVWTIVDASGEMLCRSVLPEDLEIKLVKGDRVFGVLKDELEVPRIVIYHWYLEDGSDHATLPKP